MSHMPVYGDTDSNERRLFVGIDQETAHLGDLGIVTSLGDNQVRFRFLDDGVGSQTLAAHFRDAIRGTVNHYSTGSTLDRTRQRQRLSALGDCRATDQHDASRRREDHHGHSAPELQPSRYRRQSRCLVRSWTGTRQRNPRRVCASRFVPQRCCGHNVGLAGVDRRNRLFVHPVQSGCVLVRRREGR